MNEPLPPSQPNECPVTCPNRAKQAAEIQRGSRVLTVVATAFLAFYCWRTIQRDDEINPAIFTPVFAFICYGVGVNTAPAELAKLFSGGRD